MDDRTRTELEAAAFRALRHHLIEKRPDVQNIDLMNLGGFCRNCLARWGSPLSRPGRFPYPTRQVYVRRVCRPRRLC